MKEIYDNGAIMLGEVKNVVKEIKEEMKNNIDMLYVDMDEILEELKDYKDDDIVAINYDNGMGYTIDVWSKNDKVSGFRNEVE